LHIYIYIYIYIYTLHGDCIYGQCISLAREYPFKSLFSCHLNRTRTIFWHNYFTMNSGKEHWENNVSICEMNKNIVTRILDWKVSLKYLHILCVCQCIQACFLQRLQKPCNASRETSAAAAGIYHLQITEQWLWQIVNWCINVTEKLTRYTHRQVNATSSLLH